VCRFSSAEMACAVVVTHISTLLLGVVVVVLHRSRRRLRLRLATKTRHRQRRFSFADDGGGGGLRAAYERRLPWSGGDEKAVMSLDRAAGETVSFKRGVRHYTLNDHYTNPRDARRYN